MWFKCLTCEALTRIIYFYSSTSKNIVDVELIRKGLHNTPVELRARLQTSIDQTDPSRYQAILLSYGLCGQSTLGLKSRDIPLVIPKAHDCITLFLGDRRRYNEEFTKCPGTYWYAQDYIERDDNLGSSWSLGSDSDEFQKQYNEYIQKYGQDNADYLMSVLGAWQQHYQRSVFIEMGIGDGVAVKEKAVEHANKRGWKFELMQGNPDLLRRLVEGEWENDFLVVHPGQEITRKFDQDIIGVSEEKSG